MAPPAWLVPSGPDQHERRRRPRARAEFPARLYGGDGRDTYLEAKLQSGDVSVSGVFLRSTFFLALGTAVRVEFEVPGIGTVQAGGHVVRVQEAVEPTGFAIEFESFGEGSLEALVSVFLADEVRRFVEIYSRRRRGERDAPTPTSLLHGILAWEIYRSTEEGADHD
ncbi:MAG: PilZ domain-containing protein [Pseudomonadota bacterium]